MNKRKMFQIYRALRICSRGFHLVFPDLRGGTQSAASFELGIERRNPLTREFSPASLGIDYWERAV